MPTPLEQREEIAKIIGAKLANQLLDEQLPAITYAIKQDEHAVRVCAQHVLSGDAKNPATLLGWMIREHKHTGTVGDPVPASRVIPLPPLPDETELARRKVISDEWKRISRAEQRSQDFRDLCDEYRRMNPNPSNEVAATIRAELIEVLDEMNAQKEARA